MKPEMILTDRDKKLLLLLAVILIVVAFVFLAIRPLAVQYGKTREELLQQQEQQLLNEKKEAGYQELVTYTEELQTDVEEATAEYYGMLESNEIDKLLTNLILDMGLTARELNIVMPSGECVLEPYANSQAAQEAIQNPQQEGTSTGIYAAQVSMRVSGKEEDQKELIDKISLEYPSIGITGYSWSTDTVASVGTDMATTVESQKALRINLEIYMCDKESE